MDTDSTRSRCVLCDAPMIAKRTLAREEPLLLCVPCRGRPVAERRALREQVIARVTAPPLDALLMGYRPSNLRLGPDFARPRPERSQARFLQERAAAAVAHGLRARAHGQRTILRAHVLLRYFDALVADVRGVTSARDAQRRRSKTVRNRAR